MKRFLRDIIPSDTFDFETLRADEASLITWQILDFYKRMPLPLATPERKAKHIDRIARQVGLYSLPMTLHAIGELPGEAGSASIGITIKTAKENISGVIGPNVINMLSRARKTLKEQPKEKVFTSRIELSGQ